MKQIFVKITLVLFVFGAVSCGNSEKDETKETGQTGNSGENGPDIEVTREQFEGSGMKVGQIAEKTFPVLVDATGMIDVPPENRAIISSFVDGYVKETPLLIGDKVKKGQFLVSLENPEFVQLQQDYLDAMEQMKYLKSEYARQKTLFDENITSQKNYLKSESEYKRNLSRYNGLKKKLQMLNLSPDAVEKGDIRSSIRIYAPISGSITEMKANKGMYVSAADELMQIIDPDHLHIELNVFEKDLMKVREGQAILASLPEAGSDTIAAEVHLVGTSVDEIKRTVKIHGHFKDEGKQQYATGMFVEAEIVTDTVRGKALPTESMVSIDDKNYVLLLQSQTDSTYAFKRREVNAGSAFQGFTIVGNDGEFEDGDTFLIRGAFSLLGE